jgi:hypothetical protein
LLDCTKLCHTWLGTPGIFNTQICPHWASQQFINFSSLFLHLGTRSHSGFHSWRCSERL